MTATDNKFWKKIEDKIYGDIPSEVKFICTVVFAASAVALALASIPTYYIFKNEAEKNKKLEYTNQIKRAFAEAVAINPAFPVTFTANNELWSAEGKEGGVYTQNTYDGPFSRVFENRMRCFSAVAFKREKVNNVSVAHQDGTYLHMTAFISVPNSSAKNQNSLVFSTGTTSNHVCI